MIKRLIFDIDNTLIMWDETKNIKAIKEVIALYDLDFSPDVISSIIDSLEKKYKKISKECLLKEINNYYKSNLTIDFVDKILEKQSDFYEINDSVIDTLKYLYDKYNLVILTNYFTNVQEKRLVKSCIRDYFAEIYGGDIIVQKPHDDSFSKAIGSYLKEECLMIGDNLEIDINVAISFGIKAILYDYKNKLPDSLNYQRITSFSDLKTIL